MQRLAHYVTASLALLLLSAVSQAAPITTAATLAGANENPANGSTATGNTVVVLDTATHQLRVAVVFNGLSANATGAHIHCCTSPPGNVGVATTLPAFAGFPLGVTSGSLDQTYDTTQASTWNPAFVTNNGGTTAGAEAALAAGLASGQAYLNVHTSANPGGEIRGFLVAQAPPLTQAIPTMSEWGMGALVLLLGIAAWTVIRRRAA